MSFARWPRTSASTILLSRRPANQQSSRRVDPRLRHSGSAEDHKRQSLPIDALYVFAGGATAAQVGFLTMTELGGRSARDSMANGEAAEPAAQRMSPFRRALSWCGQHLGVLIPVLGSLLVAERLLAIGGWDANTATGILREVGTVDVLVGTTVSFVIATGSLLMVFAAWFLSARMGMREPFLAGLIPGLREIEPFVPRKLFYILRYLLDVVALAMTLWILASIFSIVIFALGVLAALFGLFNRSTEYESDTLEKMVVAGIAMGLGVIFSGAYLVNKAPWIPVETVQIRDSPAPVVGWVRRD